MLNILREKEDWTCASTKDEVKEKNASFKVEWTIKIQVNLKGNQMICWYLI